MRNVFMNLLLLESIVLSLMLMGCNKEETVPKNNDNNNDNGELTYTSYIKRGENYYKLDSLNCKSGLYDGGPLYYTAIYTQGVGVDYIYNSDDVNAFTGIGSGIFVFYKSADSLEIGTHSVTEGWVGINDFNFDNPEGDIYDLGNLPNNFQYLENYDVSLTKTSEQFFLIEIETSDLVIKFEGSLNLIK